DTLVGLTRRYPDLPPVYITENGCVYPDNPGFVDQERIEFLRTHLAAATPRSPPWSAWRCCTPAGGGRTATRSGGSTTASRRCGSG
ncbi:family 1 glycosylhydrolase, partial [Saccharothrix sp. MB29]|nr:family 1 glycosylhydrolase [Saccharothrix sp. MB29]